MAVLNILYTSYTVRTQLSHCKGLTLMACLYMGEERPGSPPTVCSYSRPGVFWSLDIPGGRIRQCPVYHERPALFSRVF